jgi:hypothetical protein
MAYTTINKGSSYFNTVLYTGNGSTQSITGVGFKPDWVWNKSRSQVDENVVVDAVRGVTKTIITNSTGAEYVDDGLTAFGTDGYTLGTASRWNGSSVTYVSWNWLAANSTTSNTSGTITSTVSANTTSGFSIVSYTGTGSNATVGHGLGVTPKMIIVKKRDTAGNDWTVWGSILGGTVGSEKIVLNGTGAKSTGLNSTWFNNTAPTSTLFTIGTQGDVNGSGGTYIAYCFAEIRGYSKFGSYTGNGSANGTFVYTGFKPAFIIIKRTDVAQSWILFDNKRDPYNEATKVLYPNLNNAEDANNLDLLSNGFKPRSTSSFTNSSGNNFIYMAFAENPFVSSTQIPTTAR